MLCCPGSHYGVVIGLSVACGVAIVSAAVCLVVAARRRRRHLPLKRLNTDRLLEDGAPSLTAPKGLANQNHIIPFDKVCVFWSCLVYSFVGLFLTLM